MRLSVAFVVATAALLTVDAAKINNKRRLGNSNNKNNAATKERNLSGKGKGSSGGSVATMPMPEGSALTRAEADGLNRSQICAAGQARSSMMEMIFPMNMAGSNGKSGGKSGKGKSGKVSKAISMHAFVEQLLSARQK